MKTRTFFCLLVSIGQQLFFNGPLGLVHQESSLGNLGSHLLPLLLQNLDVLVYAHELAGDLIYFRLVADALLFELGLQGMKTTREFKQFRREFVYDLQSLSDLLDFDAVLANLEGVITALLCVEVQGLLEI